MSTHPMGSPSRLHAIPEILYFLGNNFVVPNMENANPTNQCNATRRKQHPQS